MLKIIFFTALILLPLNALVMDISIAKENNNFYSVLDLNDKDAFLCKKELDKFSNIKEIICSFSKFPKTKIQNIDNEFFHIEQKIYKDNFFLIIKPLYKVDYFPIIFDLKKEDKIFTPVTQTSKRWIFVGYKKKIPFIKKRNYKQDSIQFPFFIKEDSLPYVGGLDLKGNPVKIKNSEDVKAFVHIKKLFAKKKYDDCIEEADDVLRYYPNTLFKSELIYYKLKSFYNLHAYDEVIELSKLFLREFSSSENIPEVLMMVAYSYYKNGQYSDANYFFDRLFTEHLDSKYTQWGYIYKGDMDNSGGSEKNAEKFYKKALLQTNDIEIASNAAFRLAKLNISNGKYNTAYKYIKKIINANDKFFKEHYQESKKLMFDLADINKFEMAADIDEALLKYMTKRDDDYEVNLKNLGIWLAKTQQKKKAVKVLDRYIKEFPDGDYIVDVETTRDKIFFDIKDNNSSNLLAKYDELIKNYKDDPIGEKALYEKAKLMLKKKMYSDILQIKSDILSLDEAKYPDKEDIIKKAALGLMENALENKQCQVVLDIQNDYNITVSDKWDDGLYECFIKAADFTKAKKIVKRNLNTQNLKLKTKWMYRYAYIDFETGNYSEAIDVANDLISMVDNINKSPYKEIYRILFDAYDRVENYDKMLQTIEKIKEIFGVSYKDIKRYTKMINVGITKNDDNIIIKYALIVYNLQKKIHSNSQSPFVEFSLFQAYMNKGEYDKALDVIKSLEKLKLSKNDRARQKYLLGSVLDKLWRNDEAKKAYKEAIEASKDSTWAKLAKTALEIE